MAAATVLVARAAQMVPLRPPEPVALPNR